MEARVPQPATIRAVAIPAMRVARLRRVWKYRSTTTVRIRMGSC